MNHLQLKLCDIQGRLFELSAEKRVPSSDFIKAYMKSELAKNMDSSYNRIQWMGEEYILEELLENTTLGDASSVNEKPASYGDIYDKEVLYWIGYIYRYWHFYSGESSAKILQQAPAETMNRNYLMFHTMSPEMAIEDLKEIYRQKRSSSK